jgi:hypothetical protein
MDTLSFLKLILPEEGYKFVGLSRAGNPGIAHKAYESLELMAKAIESYDKQENLTVYHACAAYKEASYEVVVNGETKRKYRGEPNWYKAKAFWADIDCGESKAAEGKGYATKTDAARAILTFCHEHGFSLPMLVDSGGGIHCYWVLENSVGPNSWRTMASGFKSILASAGLLVDPTRTADLSSVLRPVGSHNRKANRPTRQVKVVREGEVTTAKAFYAAVQAGLAKYDVIPQQPLSRAPVAGLNDDLIGHLGPQIESSAHEVANHCAQVGKMRDTKGDVDYESWRGIIGIIKHCVEGEPLAHEWSELRAATGHSNVDVDTRYNTWDSGPATCEYFQRCNPSTCDGCVHKGNIKSPIVLGRLLPEPAESTVEVIDETKPDEVLEATVPPMPEGYEYQSEHMLRFLRDKDGVMQPYTFCRTLFYPIQRIRKSDGTFACTIRMHLPDQRVRDFEIDTASLASSTDLLKGLSKFELMPSNNKDATMHMTAYIRDSIHKLMAEQRETDTLTSFGWRDNMSGVLLGDRLYHKDGSIRKVFIGGAAADHRAAYPEPRGTLGAYSAAVNYIYNRENSQAAQYVFCNVYGSLITPFGEDSYNGALVAVNSGASGKGKTSVWRSALYGLCDANKMIFAGKEGATRNARWAIVGAHKNIPVVFDEMTDMDAAEVSAMAYTTSQGTDRARLTSAGGKVGFAEQHTWKSVVGLTANEDMHSKLASHNANTQAEAVRMIGINFATYNVPIIDPAVEVSNAIDKMRENMGNAGHEFVKYIVTHQQEVADLYAKIENKMSRLMPQSEYRFFRSHATCTLVAAKILIDHNIVDFDYQKLEDFTVTLMTDLTAAVSKGNVTDPGEAVSRMVREMSDRILVTVGYRDVRTDARGPEESLSRIRGVAVGRRILGSPHKNSGETVDPKLVGKLFIAKKDFFDWCAKNRMEPKEVLKYAQEKKWVAKNSERFNIGRGTAHSTGACVCYCFDFAAMEGAAEKTSGPSVVSLETAAVSSAGQ